MTSTEIVEARPDGRVLATVERTMSAVEVKSRVQLVQQVMRDLMKKDVHFGTIPGTDKPALYKPGAEMLAVTFRLAPELVVQDLSTADERRFRVECRMLSQVDGAYLGSGVGEASTDEEKYRWRKAVCDDEFSETPEDRRRNVYKRGRNNTTYTVNQVRTVPADLANTVLKMAAKRAQVAATLTVTGASDCFNQDLEDMTPEQREALVESEKAAGQTHPIGAKRYAALLKLLDRKGVTLAQVRGQLELKEFVGDLEDISDELADWIEKGLNRLPDKPRGGGARKASAANPASAAQEAADGAASTSGDTEAQAAFAAPSQVQELDDAIGTAPAAAGPPISAPQLTRLGAMWGDLDRLGIAEHTLRDDLEAFTRTPDTKGVRSRKDLSKAQASEYIDHLAEKTQRLRNRKAGEAA